MLLKDIEKILKNIADGKLSPAEALKELQGNSFEDIGYAKIDHYRARRTGSPEVIFAPGKTDKQIIEIFGKMYAKGSEILISRVDKPVYTKLKAKYKNIKYSETARMIIGVKKQKRDKLKGTVAVVTGGTSDIPVAEEAAVTLEAFNCTADRIIDVGVAGIHRLLAHQSKIKEASVVIVTAGMEGALASVVGGLVSAPVIAVPTSIGYGASFNGLAALLAMLNSCAPGITVVNIDNGFGAAMAALKIMRMKQA